MQLLLDKQRVQQAIDELEKRAYDKFFKDPVYEKTRGHLTTVLKLYLKEGVEGLDREYRRKQFYAGGMGSSSLMLGLFLHSIASDPELNKSATRVYSELYKQWGEFPYYNGLMFGFSLLGMIKKTIAHATDINVILEAEKMLRGFCSEGRADRGLTCFWILLRGYARDEIQ